MGEFPSLTNFFVCSLVTLGGLYWLRNFSQEYEDEYRYVFRSYFCWWLSWVVWTVTWAIIAFTEWEHNHQRLILALSDLNAIFLIAVYFSLTRGSTYKPMVALIEFGYLCAVIAAGYVIFFLLLPQRFDALQAGWGLCLSAVSTLLVGWSFVFRYKTRLVLIIGFVYAFSQPVAFDAILNKESSLPATAPVLDAFKFVLAIFKVFWATAVTMYFTQVPATKENIVVDSGRGALFPSFEKLPYNFLIQTSVLLVTLIILTLVVFFRRFPETARNEILPILTALSALVAIVTLLGKAFTWMKENVKKRET